MTSKFDIGEIYSTNSINVEDGYPVAKQTLTVYDNCSAIRVSDKINKEGKIPVIISGGINNQGEVQS